MLAVPSLLVATYVLCTRSRRRPVDRIAAARQAAKHNSVTTTPVPAAGDKHTVRIVFASNLGTGELFARSLRSDAISKGFTAEVVDIGTLPQLQCGSCDHAALANAFGTGNQTIILIIATYGEGEPTDACRSIYDALRDAASLKGGRPQVYKDFNFAVFALGDTNYKYFAKAGADMAEYVTTLGGRLIVPLARGDAKHGMEESFEEWRDALWEPLASVTDTKLHDSGDAPPRPEYEFAFRDDLKAATSPFPPRPSAMEPTMRYPFASTVVQKEILVEGDGGDGTRRTLRMSFSIENSPIAYQGGDHLGILPSNPAPLVKRCLDALKITHEDRSRVVELTSDAREDRRATRVNVLPNHVALEDALRWYVALASPLKKSTVRVLGKYAAADGDKAALLDAVSSAHSFETFVSKYRTIVDVLEAFPSCGIPVGHFLEIMPRIAPRYYSIASDMSLAPHHIDAVFVLAEGGLCTDMLNSMSIGDLAYIFVRHSTFHLNQAKKASPVIMIGAGTGVAPYFGFAQRREAWRNKKQPVGGATLYFGCRRSAVDYIRKNEWNAWLDQKVVSQLRIAFSRDDPKRKQYVQHVVAEDAAALYQAMEKEGGYLYVCGDAAGMATEVEEILKQRVLMDVGGMTEDVALQTIGKWERTGRYLKDVWSS